MPCKHLNALLNEKNVSSKGIIVIMLRTRAENILQVLKINSYVRVLLAWASARALPMRALHIFFPSSFSRSLARLSFSLVFFCVFYPVIQYCTLICSYVIYILFEHKMTNDENSFWTDYSRAWLGHCINIPSIIISFSLLFLSTLARPPTHAFNLPRCAGVAVYLSRSEIEWRWIAWCGRQPLRTNHTADFFFVTAMKKKSNMQQQLRTEMKKNNLVYIYKNSKLCPVSTVHTTSKTFFPSPFSKKFDPFS